MQIESKDIMKEQKTSNMCKKWKNKKGEYRDEKRNWTPSIIHQMTDKNKNYDNRINSIETTLK